MTVMMLLLRRKSVIGDLVSGPVYWPGWRRSNSRNETTHITTVDEIR